jgi:hypothetical protein
MIDVYTGFLTELTRTALSRGMLIPGLSLRHPEHPV